MGSGGGWHQPGAGKLSPAIQPDPKMLKTFSISAICFMALGLLLLGAWSLPGIA